MAGGKSIVVTTFLEYELYKENEALKEELKRKDRFIQELQGRLTLQTDHNFTLAARICDQSQENKITVAALQTMIADLTSQKASMMDSIQRLEAKKRPIFCLRK